MRKQLAKNKMRTKGNKDHTHVNEGVDVVQTLDHTKSLEKD